VLLSRLIEISTVGAHLAVSGIYAVVYAAYLLVNARTYERIIMPESDRPRPLLRVDTT
jgi:hypothetical protein